MTGDICYKKQKFVPFHEEMTTIFELIISTRKNIVEQPLLASFRYWRETVDGCTKFCDLLVGKPKQRYNS